MWNVSNNTEWAEFQNCSDYIFFLFTWTCFVLLTSSTLNYDFKNQSRPAIDIEVFNEQSLTEYYHEIINPVKYKNTIGKTFTEVLARMNREFHSEVT